MKKSIRWTVAPSLPKKKTRTKPTIIWKDRTGAKPAPFAKAMHNFVSSDIDSDVGSLEKWFYVGALWVLKKNMIVSTQAPIPFPYLEQAGRMMKQHPKGTVAIYAGGVHIDERTHRGNEIRVWRHTFIVGDARYIVTHVNTFMAPVK